MRNFILLALLTFPAAAQTGNSEAFLTADTFSGPDIGAKINAAFAHAGGKSSSPVEGVVVNLNPALTYTYSTTIIIPNAVSSPFITAPVLDCHGSLLTWTGAGNTDQLTVLGENHYKSGEIRNCNFASKSNSTITQYARIDFAVSHSSFSVPFRFINDTSHGGPGYTEDNHWNDIQLSVIADTCGISFQQAPGLSGGGSFFYNWFTQMHLDLAGSANGICLKTSSGKFQPGIFGGNFDLHVNTGGTGNAVFYLENGTSVVRGVVTITGENTGNQGPQYDVFANGGAIFYNFGNSNATGMVHGYNGANAISNIDWISGPQPLANDLTQGALSAGTKTLSAEPGGTAAQRLCENQQVASTTAFLLAAYGGVEQDCSFEIASRNTDNTNQDVDLAGKSGNPITTKLFAASVGGIGIGPGFTTSDPPLFALEVRGTMAVRLKGVGQTPGGATAVRQIDQNGNVQDLFTGGVPGQPSFHYRQFLYDTFKTYSMLPGLDCYARGTVYCAIPNLATGTPTNNDFAGQLTLKNGAATYTFTGAYTYPPICTASDTSAVAATQVLTSASTLTVRGNASDVINYICIGRT